MIKKDDSNLAYIAGLFDGEGCVECKQRPVLRKDRKGHPTYNQWYIRVEMTLTDEETIEWIYDTLGFGWWKEKKYNSVPNHYKRQWRWCCGFQDANKFAKMMMATGQCRIKKNQFMKVIDHYETKNQL